MPGMPARNALSERTPPTHAVANAIVTGLAFRTAPPTRVSLPASARQHTTLSDCSLVAYKNRPEGSNPINRGVRPPLASHAAARRSPVFASLAKIATLSCPRFEQYTDLPPAATAISAAVL